MLPLTLPDCDFSGSNALLLLKITKQILKNYPQEGSPATIFKSDLEEIASSNNLSTAELETQIENLYKLWAFLIYHQPKEADFRRHLSQVNIPEEIHDKFVDLWLHDGQETVERVSKITSTGIPRVLDVHCSTQLALARNEVPNCREAEIVVHLDTDKGPRKLILSREKAVQLYTEFNNLQGALDKLVE